jgi:hypothetical protein
MVAELHAYPTAGRFLGQIAKVQTLSEDASDLWRKCSQEKESSTEIGDGAGSEGTIVEVFMDLGQHEVRVEVQTDSSVLSQLHHHREPASLCLT